MHAPRSLSLTALAASTAIATLALFMGASVASLQAQSTERASRVDPMHALRYE